MAGDPDGGNFGQFPAPPRRSGRSDSFVSFICLMVLILLYQHKLINQRLRVDAQLLAHLDQLHNVEAPLPTLDGSARLAAWA
jgi:hypothetical protein